MKYGVQLQFPVTNNKVEYETILTGLRVVKALEAKVALLKSNSKLVIGQINEEFKAKEKRMQRYLKLTNQLINEFDRVSFTQIHGIKIQKPTKVAKCASSEDTTSLADLKLKV